MSCFSFVLACFCGELPHEEFRYWIQNARRDRNGSRGEIPHHNLGRLWSDPAVQAIAAAASIPLNGMLPAVSISAGEGERALRTWYNHVSPEYFNSLEIAILRAGISPRKRRSGAPVAILSESTARRLWPNGDAVGRMFHPTRCADQLARAPAAISVRASGRSGAQHSQLLYSVWN